MSHFNSNFPTNDANYYRLEEAYLKYINEKWYKYCTHLAINSMGAKKCLMSVLQEQLPSLKKEGRGKIRGRVSDAQVRIFILERDKM